MDREKEMRLLLWLKQHPRFTTRELMKFLVSLGYKPGSARNIITHLRLEGVIEEIGKEGHTVVYRSCV
ncbi:MAG: hypothetical protein DRN54_01855 [Thaumarchaeota archaeon]|nr:MAG: hypothetical protein DRN54_01855 [Nitrososphaerota archaeon]